MMELDYLIGIVSDFKTIAGQRFKIGALNKNEVRLRVQNCTIDECEEYLDFLMSKDFELFSKKEISAGHNRYNNKNLFYQCTKKNYSLIVFFDCSTGTAFITGEITNFGIKNKFMFSQAGNNEVTFSQININMGMCYVLKLKDGTFVVFDGGIRNNDDELKLLDYLVSNSNLEKPIISTWYLTHSHVDHISLAEEFIKKFHNEVEIKSFGYQFPDCDMIDVSMENPKEMAIEISEFENTIKQYCKDAYVFKPHTGQSYYYDGVEIEIIYSPDNLFPYPYTSFNDPSLALRIKTETGKTVMMLGDCMSFGCRDMAHIYGNYLKSDYMQVTHHGLLGGNIDLYQLIDSDVCFWPTPDIRFNGKLSGQRFQWCLGEGGCDYNAYIRDDSIKKRTHYSHKDLVTVNLG